VLRDYLDYRPIAKLHSLSSDRVWIEQVHGLRALMKRLFDVPFYGDRLRKAGTKPGDLRTVKDLAMMPATTAAQFAQELRRRAADQAAAGASFDAAGHVLRHALGADAHARRLHLFAALGAWGAGARSVVEICGEGFGEDVARGALLFRVRRSEGPGAAERVGAFARILSPGSFASLARAESMEGTRGPAARAIVVLAGAPIPEIRSPDSTPLEARAILGNAVYGPIAWQCAAGAFHPIAGRAVIEAVTAESAARGLTGGSRASRAPREAGALHLTLIESSELPVFRVEMGLRGRIHPADCGCGARTNRLEMETAFLGPLVVPRVGAGAGAGASALDPLPILRAAAAEPSVHRVALIQDAPDRVRVVLCGEGSAEPVGAHAMQAAASARIDALAAPSNRGVEIVVEAGEESKLPFPERGFVQGLGVEPILSIATSSA
jgi:hypothetical protein